MLRNDAILQGLIEPTDEEREKFNIPKKDDKSKQKKKAEKKVVEETKIENTKDNEELFFK